MAIKLFLMEKCEVIVVKEPSVIHIFLLWEELYIKIEYMDSINYS